VDHLLDTGSEQPHKYADLPGLDTGLSVRWQRCAWQQACGLVQSWSSNQRINRPVVQGWCIQGNANVVVLEQSATPTFDFWLRISTLSSGEPVRIPLKLYENAQTILKQYERLCSGVTLNRWAGQWYATLVVERHNRKGKAKRVIGGDIGMKAVVTTWDGQRYGEFSPVLQERLGQRDAKRRRKQQLNTGLVRKGLPPVDRHDHRAEAWVRCEVGHALNQMLEALPTGVAFALENLKVADMRFKARQLNRLLKAHQLGFIRDRLRFKLDERAIRYRSVQPAYSSQQCSHCGFTLSLNRRTQADFECLWCGHQQHADVNAALNIAERFGDAVLNALPFRQVEPLLAVRFLQRLSDARSASAGRDTLTTVVLDSTQLVPPPGQALFPGKTG
jgi:hypothetical protein